MNPASRRSGAYEGGARNAKHDESPGAPHFEEPRFVSVPSRFPQTTSPVRSRRTDLKYESAGPCDHRDVAGEREADDGLLGAAPPDAAGTSATASEHQRRVPLLTESQGAGTRAGPPCTLYFGRTTS